MRDNGRGGMPLFQPHAQGRVWSAEKIAAFQAGMATPVGEAGWRRGWLAYDAAGAISGHVDLRAHPEICTSHRALLGMGVHRDHRRRGLGGVLLVHAMSWARAGTMLEWIDLHYLAGNMAAERLYGGHGFQRIGVTDDMFRVYGQSVGDVAMTLRLRP